MEQLNDSELLEINGGFGNDLMGMKLSKLKEKFEKACKRKKMDEVMRLRSELQARGEYSWARETAVKYGISSF